MKLREGQRVRKNANLLDVGTHHVLLNHAVGIEE
jgi:hypothetical protein